jgi:hypothetical protein
VLSLPPQAYNMELSNNIDKVLFMKYSMLADVVSLMKVEGLITCCRGIIM